MGNSIVRAAQSQGGSSQTANSAAPLDPDTGKFSPGGGFDLDAHLANQKRQQSIQTQAAENLNQTVAFQLPDFDLSANIYDFDAAGALSDLRAREYLQSRALAGDGLSGIRAGLNPGIFDNAIMPDNRGFFEKAGDYAFNGVQVIGGALQAIGDPISNAIEGVFRDPVSVLHGANDFLRSGVDVLYGATIDPVARSLGLGNGAVERNAARVQNYLGDTLGNFGDVESALTLSYGNSDFNGLGKAITGGVFAAAGLITPRGVLGSFDDYVGGLRRFNTPINTSANLFEIEHTGPHNFTILGGGTSIDIDGFSGNTILEAKFIGNPSRSPFIDNSDIPQFLRSKIQDQQRFEFERFNAVLSDSSVPFNNLNVLINDQRGVPFFNSLMNDFNIPGQVQVVPTNIK